MRANDNGDLVVTKGDQYDVREHTKENEVIDDCTNFVYILMLLLRKQKDENGT